MGGLIGTATDSKNGLMPTSVYKNYCRELSTSSNSRKLWKITEANYDAPILLRIYGRNSGNSFYLTDFVINKNNSRRYDLFNETQSTLILYRKDNFIYIELQGTYSSAIVDLQSRNSQLNPEDVTDSVSTSSLQEIN